MKTDEAICILKSIEDIYVEPNIKEVFEIAIRSLKRCKRIDDMDEAKLVSVYQNYEKNRAWEEGYNYCLKKVKRNGEKK